MSVDVSLFGDKALQKALDRLGKQAPKIVRRAQRESAKRVKPQIAAAAPVRTGRLRAAMLAAPIRALKKGKAGTVGVGIALPDRTLLGLPPAGPFYPAIIEYGRPGVPPVAFFRNTVDRMAPAEFQLIGDAIRRGVEKAGTAK